MNFEQIPNIFTHTHTFCTACRGVAVRQARRVRTVHNLTTHLHRRVAKAREKQKNVSNFHKLQWDGKRQQQQQSTHFEYDSIKDIFGWGRQRSRATESEQQQQRSHRRMWMKIQKFSKNKCRIYFLLVVVAAAAAALLVVVVVVKQHMVACVRKTLYASFGCESFAQASCAGTSSKRSKREDCFVRRKRMRKLRRADLGGFFCVPGGDSNGPQTTTVTRHRPAHYDRLTGRGSSRHALRIRRVASPNRQP